MAKVNKKPRLGPLLTATVPSKLLKAIVAQATAENLSFSEYVIELFESATVGGVRGVK